MKVNKTDAVIIGGGFYGAAIAIYLKRQRGLNRVVLVEKEDKFLSRASYNNQARVHNGYHYPRSFTTAFRSKINMPKFVRDWPNAVKQDFTKLYAISRRNSKVTAKQFERFCNEIGASIKPADLQLKKLFEPRLIESVFLVEEYAFDTNVLAEWAKSELQDAGVEIMLSAQATSITRGESIDLIVSINKNNDVIAIKSPYVFNCTYSGLNQLSGDFKGTITKLKHEITEMALIKVPDPLKFLGITVMDGPFFSIMPFPARELHTLSHVRYTPHYSWEDKSGIDPYKTLQEYKQYSRFDRMLRDVSRYIPSISKSEYVDSLFEVKTILTKNENDDGRPILFENYSNLPGYYSILGGKIDNIYDVLERLDTESFDLL